MKSTRRKPSRSIQQTLPALVAVGGSIAALPAAALELGDVSVHSGLGQPLRASISYALAPHEQLASQCVTLRSGPTSSGFPGIGPATLSVANGVIKLTGNSPIREPMMTAYVMVNCPYAPNISREYTLFVSPQAPVQETVTAPRRPVAQPQASTAPVSKSIPAARTAASPVAPTTVKKTPIRKDLNIGDRIQVRPGDTLGGITQRIENRSVALWPAAMVIFDANPEAFIDSDPNKLKAGSWLSIPGSLRSDKALATETPTTVDRSSTVPSAVVDKQIVDRSTSTELADTTPTATTVDTAAVTTNDLQPGIDTAVESPFVEPTPAETVLISDTVLEGPTTVSTSPNVATATLVGETTPTNNASQSPWLWWLAGSGIALILALLLFGRRLTQRSGSTPSFPAVDDTAQHLTDSETANAEALGSEDCDLHDDSPTEENLVLDADLVIGTGLSNGPEISVEEDFGFATATKLDVELPFEPLASEDSTTVQTSLRTDAHSILDSEVLPNDDDYDMSVIVDATKIPHPEDATACDLQAVVVDAGDETLITDNYTISKEVDFEILEQDYEDELTATQALNVEITRAAIELAAQIDRDGVEDENDETAMLPLASVTELDVTSQLPASNEDIGDEDETGVNETLVGEEKTVEMPAADAEADTVDMKLGSGKAR